MTIFPPDFFIGCFLVLSINWGIRWERKFTLRFRDQNELAWPAALCSQAGNAWNLVFVLFSLPGFCELERGKTDLELFQTVLLETDLDGR